MQVVRLYHSAMFVSPITDLPDPPLSSKPLARLARLLPGGKTGEERRSAHAALRRTLMARPRRCLEIDFSPEQQEAAQRAIAALRVVYWLPSKRLIAGDSMSVLCMTKYRDGMEVLDLSFILKRDGFQFDKSAIKALCTGTFGEFMKSLGLRTPPPRPAPPARTDSGGGG